MARRQVRGVAPGGVPGAGHRFRGPPGNRQAPRSRVIQLGPHEFREVVLADFEFEAPPGERPTPVCLVAHELRSGRTYRLWQDDLQRLTEPPYPVEQDCLFIAYYASAELGCHLALGWRLPVNVL